MKILKQYITLITVWICAGCTTHTAMYDTELLILIDRTDPLSVRPEAERICALTGLRHNKWLGVRVRISYISDKDVNDVKTISLPRENSLLYNPQKRDAEVKRFEKEMNHFLKSVNNTSTFTHSIIYRAIAKHTLALSTSKAHTKYLLIYSNMMENSEEVTVYDPATFKVLQSNPDSIRQILEKTATLGRLSGVEIWLLHKPASYEENRTYIQVSHFWCHLFEAKGALVHVQSNLE